MSRIYFYVCKADANVITVAWDPRVIQPLQPPCPRRLKKSGATVRLRDQGTVAWYMHNRTIFLQWWVNQTRARKEGQGYCYSILAWSNRSRISDCWNIMWSFVTLPTWQVTMFWILVDNRGLRGLLEHWRLGKLYWSVPVNNFIIVFAGLFTSERLCFLDLGLFVIHFWEFIWYYEVAFCNGGKVHREIPRMVTKSKSYKTNCNYRMCDKTDFKCDNCFL